MDQRRIDAGLVHLGQELLGRELIDLAMRSCRLHHRLRPDMHLRIDDLHGRSSHHSCSVAGDHAGMALRRKPSRVGPKLLTIISNIDFSTRTGTWTTAATSGAALTQSSRASSP